MFTTRYRDKLVNEVAHRFKCYWHAMHPVTFDANDLYRLAFTTEEWSAMMLLKERFPDTLRTGYQWKYIVNQTEDCPALSLQFSTDNHMPEIELNERDLPDALAERLRAWTHECYRLDQMQVLLRKKLRQLVQLEYNYDHDNEGPLRRAVVNTPGTMHRVWPEILPFLDNQSRDTMRNKHAKSPLPKGWNIEEYNVFHEGNEMVELTEALAVMALLPNDYDQNYPDLR